MSGSNKGRITGNLVKLHSKDYLMKLEGCAQTFDVSGLVVAGTYSGGNPPGMLSGGFFPTLAYDSNKLVIISLS